MRRMLGDERSPGSALSCDNQRKSDYSLPSNKPVAEGKVGMERHFEGAGARTLLISVFGPYARDDEFGSRSMKPMELYHNQVTREQGNRPSTGMAGILRSGSISAPPPAEPR